MGTRKKRRKGASREIPNRAESHLESIEPLPLVSMETKSIRETCGKGLRSRNFPVPHEEEQ